MFDDIGLETSYFYAPIQEVNVVIKVYVVHFFLEMHQYWIKKNNINYEIFGDN